MRQGSPARPGGACGGRMSRQSAAASVDSIELSCGASGRDARQAVGGRGERRPDVVLAGVVGRDIDGEDARARSCRGAARRGGPRSAAAEKDEAADQRRDRIAGQAEDADGGAAAPGTTEHQRLAGAHGDLPEIERACRRRRAPSATRSWSPTEAPPRVTTTSAASATARRTTAAMAPASSRTMPRSMRLAAGGGDQRGEAEGVGGDDLVGAGQRAGRHQFVAGGDDGDARAAADRDGGVAHRGGERRARGSRGGRRRARRTSPSAKSRPARRTWRPGDRGLADADRAVGQRLGVLLDQDRVGARRAPARR